MKLYQTRNPHVIRLLFQENNKGIRDNYADLLSLARGKYIAQIAGDDFWCLNTKLQIQKNYLDTHQDCGLCFTNINLCDEDDNITEERYLNEKNISRSFEEHLLTRGYIAPLTWMYRKEMVKLYDINGAFTDESFAFALDIYAQSKIDYIDVVSAVYRVANGSLSHPTSKEKWYKQYLGVFRAQLYYCDKYKMVESVIKIVRINGYIQLLPYAITNGDNAFIEECLQYSQQIGLQIEPYLNVCKGKFKAENKIAFIQNSPTYKIGRFLLTPVRIIKKMIHHK